MITWLIIIASVLYYVVSWRITLALFNKAFPIGRQKHYSPYHEPGFDLFCNVFWSTLCAPFMIFLGVGAILVCSIDKLPKKKIDAVSVGNTLAWTSRAEKKRRKLAP